MSTELKEHGHQFDSSWITRPLREGESIESVLCGHSEKLAIAFNFLKRPDATFIQVTKNLRVCGDCRKCPWMRVRRCSLILSLSDRSSDEVDREDSSVRDRRARRQSRSSLWEGRAMLLPRPFLVLPTSTYVYCCNVCYVSY